MLRSVFVLSIVVLIMVTQCTNSDVTPPATMTATPTPQIGVTLATMAPPTAAVQQTTSTPLPPTPLPPTATPIVYQVQEGDTLLAIALQQGVTVDEIVAVNPGLNRDFLTIGQAITLPPRPTAVAQRVVGTAVPLAIDVAQINTYQTPIGTIWALGELVNRGDVAAENVQVQIAWRTASGDEVARHTAWAALPILPVGGTSPFGVLVTEALPDAVEPVVSVIGGQSVVDLGSRYLDVTVTETAVDLSGARVGLSGQVQNDGDVTAADVTVVATFYDAAGDVTGFQIRRLPGTLAAGGTAVFSVTAAPPGGQSSDVAVAVQAQMMEQ